MNPLRIVVPALCLAVISQAVLRAQEDTKLHRAVYKETNDHLGDYKKIPAIHSEDETRFDLTGWFDGTELRRVDSRVPGEDGDGKEEYYFDGGELLFAFRHYKVAGAKGGAKPGLVEDRFYFRDGRMFKWISTEKSPVDPSSEDFTIEEERLLANSSAFSAALEKAALPPSVTNKLRGTFSGVEQGDYAHWRMRDRDGGERTFMILRPDASVEEVLRDPDAFSGKSCTVTWKKSRESIPEAGGKIEVEQILSVVWDR